jgi:hypothetical protein
LAQSPFHASALRNLGRDLDRDYFDGSFLLNVKLPAAGALYVPESHFGYTNQGSIMSAPGDFGKAFPVVTQRSTFDPFVTGVEKKSCQPPNLGKLEGQKVAVLVE